MERTKGLEELLQRQGQHKSDGMELILFTRAGEFGVGYFDSYETDSDHLDSEDCEYADSLEEAIDKAIKRWS
jgi:hypothetical protein